MKKRIGSLIIGFVLSFHSSVFADRALKVSSHGDNYSQKVALVIGNSAYKTSPLKNPRHDAEDMAIQLRELGFQVTIQTNVGRIQMQKSIRNFGNQLKKGGVGLFFFAGHGMQVKGINYLIPVDADIQSEDEVQDYAVDAGMVLRKMQSAGNPLNMVFLDACRNNPYARSFRSASMGLAQMDAPKGSLIVYATSPGSVAADGKGRNGIFTKNLLNHIREPGIEVGRMLRNVRRDVLRETGDKQTPWDSSSLIGDFYFKKSTQVASGSFQTETSETGGITINSQPENARIYVNGAYYGETPDTLNGMPAGNYRIKLTKTGYSDWQKRTYLAENKEVHLNARLSKKRSAIVAYSPQPVQAKHSFAGTGKCRACHKKAKQGEQYNKWSKGPHARAYNTLATNEAKKLAAEIGIFGDPQQAKECLICHAASKYDSQGKSRSARMFGKKFKMTDGVQCEDCHGAGQKYWKKKVMKKIAYEGGALQSATAKKTGLFAMNENVCKRCHVAAVAIGGVTYQNPTFRHFFFEQASRAIAHLRP
jgi:Caspase domain/PEGA domain/Cytochrome c554 and c-prime